MRRSSAKRDVFYNTYLRLNRSIKIKVVLLPVCFPVKLVSLTCVFCLVLNRRQIPKKVADIFNASGDKEDFLGFQEDASRQRLLSEDSHGSFDTQESGIIPGRDCHSLAVLSWCSCTLSLRPGCTSHKFTAKPGICSPHIKKYIYTNCLFFLVSMIAF